MIISRKKAEDAAAVFGFDISSGLLDKQAVEAAYRTEAKRAHPDAGGSLEAFAAVDHAKHVLLHWLAMRDGEPEKPHGGVTKCPRCDGKGYMELHGARLGSVMRKQCPTCKGNGELYDEKDKDGDRI